MHAIPGSSCCTSFMIVKARSRRLEGARQPDAWRPASMCHGRAWRGHPRLSLQLRKNPCFQSRDQLDERCKHHIVAVTARYSRCRDTTWADRSPCSGTWSMSRSVALISTSLACMRIRTMCCISRTVTLWAALRLRQYQQFGPIFKVHGVKVRPPAAPDEAMPFEDSDDVRRDAVRIRRDNSSGLAP